jgi:hypothetical protein
MVRYDKIADVKPQYHSMRAMMRQNEIWAVTYRATIGVSEPGRIERLMKSKLKMETGKAKYTCEFYG